MTDYNFIKRCKNYNIKNSKGFIYETIINISLNKIKKLDEEINYNYYRRDCFFDEINKLKNDYVYNKKIRLEEYIQKYLYLKKIYYRNLYKIFYMNLFIEKEQEKFKMCIHKLKLSLPDHLIYEIGTYL